MAHRENTLFLISLLLAATTATALVQIHRLRSRQFQLDSELTRLRATAEAKSSAAPEPGPSPAPRVVTITRDVPAAPGLEAELATSRAEIESLKAQLEERPARFEGNSPTNRVGRSDREGRDRWRDDFMEYLKQTDPQRFQEIETQRAEFRERIKADTQDKHSFLSSVDVSQWPADLQENHGKIVALYEKMNEAITRNADGELPDREAVRTMFSQWRETERLLDTERDMLLYDTAKQIGFEGANADQFVDYIKTIQQVTSPRGFFPGRGGGRPPGPGGTAP